jgi:hypothetical protein
MAINVRSAKAHGGATDRKPSRGRVVLTWLAVPAILITAGFIGINIARFSPSIVSDIIPSTIQGLLSVWPSQINTAVLRPGFENCTPAHFSASSLPDSSLPASISRLHVSVQPVYNYTPPSPAPWDTRVNPFFAPSLRDLSFCNVTYTYTTPGYGNRVNVYVYLPPPSSPTSAKRSWNGRFQGVGGGGFAVSMGDAAMLPAVVNRYAAASSDGGFYAGEIVPGNPASWVTTAPGAVDWNAIHMFGRGAVEDLTRIGQAVTTRYYGVEARELRSYWNGCSTGGRQGYTLAQRVPELYDGILAVAPAVDYSKILWGGYFPQFLMTVNDSYTQPCELDFLTKKAIAECDPLDGVEDGIVSRPELCSFAPDALAGDKIPCPAHPDGETTLSPFAVELVKQLWDGPRSASGELLYHPFPPEATLLATANTVCNYTGLANDRRPSCSPAPTWLASWFIANFNLKRKPTTPPGQQLYFPEMTPEGFWALLKASEVDYTSAMSATNPDLSAFARASRRPKMITWHGLADELIAANHTLSYYQSVNAHFDANRPDYVSHAAGDGTSPASPSAVSDFFRWYAAPGVRHCAGGQGAYPGMMIDSAGALDALVKWVEDGDAPETLHAVSDEREDLRHNSPDARLRRPLCAWPKRAEWTDSGKSTDWWEAEGWRCVDGDDTPV